MVEVAAALAGAVATAGLMGIGVTYRQRTEGEKAAVRLTVAVENVATRLEELHLDFKADRRETYQRLNHLEQRVAKLEAIQP